MFFSECGICLIALYLVLVSYFYILILAISATLYYFVNRLKTWLRSKMGQDRLTGLALLNIHRSIEINVDDVIDRFTSLKKRNIDFVL